jgi:hypothetical protein
VIRRFKYLDGNIAAVVFDRGKKRLKAPQRGVARCVTSPD